MCEGSVCNKRWDASWYRWLSTVRGGGIFDIVLGLLFQYSFHSVFCLTRGPTPPPKRFLNIVRSRAFSFKWGYPLLSLRSSSSIVRLLPRLLVTSISPFIFPSVTCFRRQFLRKMWPIQLAFLFLISCRINILRIYCAPSWLYLQDWTRLMQYTILIWTAKGKRTLLKYFVLCAVHPFVHTFLLTGL